MAKAKTKGTYEKTLVIPVSLEMWKSLRKISYDQELSMSQMIRESVEKIIKKYDKTIDSDL